MGPPSAPDYVDVVMSKFDLQIVEECGNQVVSIAMWTRYRDDGFVVVSDGDNVGKLETI